MSDTDSKVHALSDMSSPVEIRAGQALNQSRLVADAVAQVQTHISHQPHVQRLFSFMPTLMTRISPFHFRDKHRYKDWPLVRLDSGDGAAWGRMTLVGELLIIFDESVLFGLLALLRHFGSDAFEAGEDDICRLSGVDPTTANIQAVWKSVQRLAGTRIDLDLLSGRGRSRRPVRQMTGSILTFCDRDPDAQKIRVMVNPYFLEMYGQSVVTNIDLSFRSSLSHDVSKALYRYFQGQIDRQFEMKFDRLSGAVNLDIEREAATVRRQLRTGLRELLERGYLAVADIGRDGDVTIEKSVAAAPAPGQMILD